MSLLQIIINVDADTTRTDPHEVFEAICDVLDTNSDFRLIDVGGERIEANFVSAEWHSDGR